MRVTFEKFQNRWDSWEELFGKAAEYASQISPERLISISHSDYGDGTVTVWYWQD